MQDARAENISVLYIECDLLLEQGVGGRQCIGSNVNAFLQQANQHHQTYIKNVKGVVELKFCLLYVIRGSGSRSGALFRCPCAYRNYYLIHGSLPTLICFLINPRSRGSLAVVSHNRESTEPEANLLLTFPLEAFRFSSAMSILQYCIPSHSN